MRDFRLPSQSVWELHSSGTLCSGSRNFLPTFWDNLSVPSSGVKPLNMGPIGCPKMSVWNNHYLLHTIPEECSSHMKHLNLLPIFVTAAIPLCTTLALILPPWMTAASKTNYISRWKSCECGDWLNNRCVASFSRFVFCITIQTSQN
jgi:hypothetical protein